MKCTSMMRSSRSLMVEMPSSACRRLYGNTLLVSARLT